MFNTNQTSLRESSNNVEEAHVYQSTKVDNLAVTMECIDLVKQSVRDKTKVVEETKLVEIPISKDSKSILPTKNQVMWKRNQKAIAKKASTRISACFELQKKKKKGKLEEGVLPMKLRRGVMVSKKFQMELQ